MLSEAENSEFNGSICLVVITWYLTAQEGRARAHVCLTHMRARTHARTHTHDV
jgi:hypothetical protein